MGAKNPMDISRWLNTNANAKRKEIKNFSLYGEVEVWFFR